MYFPFFQTADWGQKIRYPAADDLFRASLADEELQMILGLLQILWQSRFLIYSSSG